MKGLDEELKVRNQEELGVGSLVRVTGGSHKGLSAKVVAIQKQKTASKESAFGMADSKN